jgi:hypothetical protein
VITYHLAIQLALINISETSRREGVVSYNPGWDRQILLGLKRSKVTEHLSDALEEFGRHVKVEGGLPSFSCSQQRDEDLHP